MMIKTNIDIIADGQFGFSAAQPPWEEPLWQPGWLIAWRQCPPADAAAGF